MKQDRTSNLRARPALVVLALAAAGLLAGCATPLTGMPHDASPVDTDPIAELRQLDTRAMTAAAPEMVLIAQGDEVLDWREMSERYPHALQLVQEGGDHALSNFTEYLPRVDEFLHLA